MDYRQRPSVYDRPEASIATLDYRQLGERHTRNHHASNDTPEGSDDAPCEEDGNIMV